MNPVAISEFLIRTGSTLAPEVLLHVKKNWVQGSYCIEEGGFIKALIYQQDVVVFPMPPGTTQYDPLKIRAFVQLAQAVAGVTDTILDYTPLSDRMKECIKWPVGIAVSAFTYSCLNTARLVVDNDGTLLSLSCSPTIATAIGLCAAEYGIARLVNNVAQSFFKGMQILFG